MRTQGVEPRPTAETPDPFIAAVPVHNVRFEYLNQSSARQHKAAYQSLAQVDLSTLASTGRFYALESSTRCKCANSHWSWLERIA
jgi:hypothetical protein